MGIPNSPPKNTDIRSMSLPMLDCFMEAEHILVIGGGVAGLTAAIELVRAGHRITLLEASHRLGGRIFTAHHAGTPIELGAEFIHGGSDSLWKTVRTGRLKTIRVPDRFRLFENGRFHQTDLWSQVEEVMAKIKPDGPDMSFARFLAGQRLSAGTKTLVTNFVEGFDAADPHKIGVHGLATAGEEDEDDPGEHQFRLMAGYSALIDVLVRQARKLGVDIKTDTVVRSIEWQVGHVRARAWRKQRHRVFEADAAVIALPLGVLKTDHVRFRPALPEKEKAIAGLQFGNVTKIILKFKRTFWPGNNFGFVVATDEMFPTWWSDSRGPILTGWAGGPKADALSQKTKPQLEREAIGILSRLFRTDDAKIRKSLVRSDVHDWRKDRFIGGAYSYVPVKGSDLPKRLAAPVNYTLYFAGEATVSDGQPGTVHGAMDSGRRAAREFLASR